MQICEPVMLMEMLLMSNSTGGNLSNFDIILILKLSFSEIPDPNKIIWELTTNRRAIVLDVENTGAGGKKPLKY